MIIGILGLTVFAVVKSGLCPHNQYLILDLPGINYFVQEFIVVAMGI